jgi:hypothetical protein
LFQIKEILFFKVKKYFDLFPVKMDTILTFLKTFFSANLNFFLN